MIVSRELRQLQRAAVYADIACVIIGLLWVGWLVFAYLNIFGVVRPWPHDAHNDLAIGFWLLTTVVLIGITVVVGARVADVVKRLEETRKND